MWNFLLQLETSLVAAKVCQFFIFIKHCRFLRWEGLPSHPHFLLIDFFLTNYCHHMGVCHFFFLCLTKTSWNFGNASISIFIMIFGVMSLRWSDICVVEVGYPINTLCSLNNKMNVFAGLRIIFIVVEIWIKTGLTMNLNCLLHQRTYGQVVWKWDDLPNSGHLIILSKVDF